MAQPQQMRGQGVQVMDDIITFHLFVPIGISHHLRLDQMTVETNKFTLLKCCLSHQIPAGA